VKIKDANRSHVPVVMVSDFPAGTEENSQIPFQDKKLVERTSAKHFCSYTSIYIVG
jgi:hypothetical protein